MKNKKKMILIVVGILAVIALGFGVTYAWLTLTLNGTKSNVLKIGTLSLVLDDTAGEGIYLEGAVPMLDEVGVNLDPYTFTLTNNGSIDSDYTIYLDDVDLEAGEDRVDPFQIRSVFGNIDGDEAVEIKNLGRYGAHPNRILESGKLKPGESHRYELRLWLSEYAGNDVMGKVFKGKIRVEASQVMDTIPVVPEDSCFTLKETAITGYRNDCPKNIIIPDTINGVTITTIGDDRLITGPFVDKQLTSVVIPNTVTSIKDYSFRNNKLTTLTIPDSVTSIGESAFENNMLIDLTLSNSIVSIGASAFLNN